MARGKDERNNKKRNPMILRNVDTPNVLWVNFKDPSQPHEAVTEYITELAAQRSRSAHPSNFPKEPE